MSDRLFDDWLRKITYTKAYMYGYLLTVVTGIVALIVLFNYTERSDVTNISIEYFKNKTLERENFIREFFKPYTASIRAVAESAPVREYLDGRADYASAAGYFQTIKKSLPCVFKVRYIDSAGMERIRVEGTPVGLAPEHAVSRIVPAEQLQQKFDRYYVRQFRQLPRGELGISKIDLNVEHGRVEIPKRPVVRLGMTVFDSQGRQQGIIVYNICLRTLFHQLDETTLYTVHLIDGEGRFLLNNQNGHGGIYGDRFDSATIADEYGAEAAGEMLNSDEYYGGNFYVRRLDGFENGQDLKMILDLKFGAISAEDQAVKRQFLLWLVAIALLLLPVIYLFAKIPEKMKQRMNREALSDGWTGLPNRRCLFKDLQEQTFSDAIIILVHLGNYGKIQNIYGHGIASTLLRKAAHFINEYRDPQVETVYRYSDDSFAMKYRYSDDATLRRFVKQLHRELEHHPFVVENDIELLLDVTIGVSDCKRLNNSIDELKEAEVALEHAIDEKEDFAVYDFRHLYSVERNRENLDIAKNIKHAIDTDGMELHYQPILNNVTGKIEKYEALMRLKREDGLIFPDSFLPIAKELKKYKRLTYMLIERAFAFFKDKPYEFSINLSAEDVYDATFREEFFARIEEYGVQKRLVVEIVESESIRDYVYFYDFIKRVKAAGCKVAIDDFGSGYSNFQHLIALSDFIDYIKIDGSLIRDITTDDKSQLLVESIKAFCDKLAIRTIAEYVESEAILEYLCRIGIDYSQGYYIGKPAPDLQE